MPGIIARLCSGTKIAAATSWRLNVLPILRPGFHRCRLDDCFEASAYASPGAQDRCR